jgi:hypothetical protein
MDQSAANGFDYRVKQWESYFVHGIYANDVGSAASNDVEFLGNSYEAPSYEIVEVWDEVEEVWVIVM